MAAGAACCQYAKQNNLERYQGISARTGKRSAQGDVSVECTYSQPCVREDEACLLGAHTVMKTDVFGS